MTIFSNNDEDGILFLYEYNPYNNEYPEKTYLCRLSTTEQKITLCEAVNMEYLGRTLKFDSYDIVNEENNKKNISSLKNPNHKIIKSKYDKLLFKEYPYHHIKTKYISYYNKKNILCKKINNDNMECIDANYGGRLIFLDDGYYDLHKKYLYVPNNCLGENLNSSCSPYICDIQDTNEFVPCEYEEMSVVKNIRPINNIMPTKIIMPKKDMRPINEIIPCEDLMPCKYVRSYKHMLPPYNIIPLKGIRPIKNIGPNSKNPHAISLKNKDINHENRLNNSALFAMSFMSFLVIFIFFFCLLYRFLFFLNVIFIFILLKFF
ncbi:fam-e protein [Plasmodium gallinaceum]|uniref:Fam-e protein n=1 Tax=Plasmodium gallinaceum TaxID=5849 RepID=A0A1J1GUA0_PLAGA|nr:fam-e protein [Plasmodium gallinaceum]CRG96058.1 fam-e protein [Plasmodium gallinaceum]